MTKFTEGTSGNVNGRPKNKTPATILRKSIVDDMPEIIKTLISLAKGGDVAAAKVLLDRCCPTLKPQAMPIKLTCMTTPPPLSIMKNRLKFLLDGCNYEL